jgi:hypothetical protein
MTVMCYIFIVGGRELPRCGSLEWCAVNTDFDLKKNSELMSELKRD